MKVCISLDKETVNQLQDLSTATRGNVSKFIREVVNKLYQAKHKQPEEPEGIADSIDS